MRSAVSLALLLGPCRAHAAETIAEPVKKWIDHAKDSKTDPLLPTFCADFSQGKYQKTDSDYAALMGLWGDKKRPDNSSVINYYAQIQLYDQNNPNTSILGAYRRAALDPKEMQKDPRNYDWLLQNQDQFNRQNRAANSDSGQAMAGACGMAALAGRFTGYLNDRYDKEVMPWFRHESAMAQQRMAQQRFARERERARTAMAQQPTRPAPSLSVPVAGPRRTGPNPRVTYSYVPVSAPGLTRGIMSDVQGARWSGETDEKDLWKGGQNIEEARKMLAYEHQHPGTYPKHDLQVARAYLNLFSARNNLIAALNKCNTQIPPYNSASCRALLAQLKGQASIVEAIQQSKFGMAGMMRNLKPTTLPSTLYTAIKTLNSLVAPQLRKAGLHVSSPEDLYVKYLTAAQDVANVLSKSSGMTLSTTPKGEATVRYSLENFQANPNSPAAQAEINRIAARFNIAPATVRTMLMMKLSDFGAGNLLFLSFDAPPKGDSFSLSLIGKPGHVSQVFNGLIETGTKAGKPITAMALKVPGGTFQRMEAYFPGGGSKDFWPLDPKTRRYNHIVVWRKLVNGRIVAANPRLIESVPQPPDLSTWDFFNDPFFTSVPPGWGIFQAPTAVVKAMSVGAGYVTAAGSRALQVLQGGARWTASYDRNHNLEIPDARGPEYNQVRIIRINPSTAPTKPVPLPKGTPPVSLRDLRNIVVTPPARFDPWAGPNLNLKLHGAVDFFKGMSFSEKGLESYMMPFITGRGAGGLTADEKARLDPMVIADRNKHLHDDGPPYLSQSYPAVYRYLIQQKPTDEQRMLYVLSHYGNDAIYKQLMESIGNRPTDIEAWVLLAIHGAPEFLGQIASFRAVFGALEGLGLLARVNGLAKTAEVIRMSTAMLSLYMTADGWKGITYQLMEAAEACAEYREHPNPQSAQKMAQALYQAAQSLPMAHEAFKAFHHSIKSSPWMQARQANLNRRIAQLRDRLSLSPSDATLNRAFREASAELGALMTPAGTEPITLESKPEEQPVERSPHPHSGKPSQPGELKAARDYVRSKLQELRKKGETDPQAREDYDYLVREIGENPSDQVVLRIWKAHRQGKPLLAARTTRKGRQTYYDQPDNIQTGLTLRRPDGEGNPGLTSRAARVIMDHGIAGFSPASEPGAIELTNTRNIERASASDGLFAPAGMETVIKNAAGRLKSPLQLLGRQKYETALHFIGRLQAIIMGARGRGAPAGQPYYDFIAYIWSGRDILNGFGADTRWVEMDMAQISAHFDQLFDRIRQNLASGAIDDPVLARDIYVSGNLFNAELGRVAKAVETEFNRHGGVSGFIQGLRSRQQRLHQLSHSDGQFPMQFPDNLSSIERPLQGYLLTPQAREAILRGRKLIALMDVVEDVRQNGQLADILNVIEALPASSKRDELISGVRYLSKSYADAPQQASGAMMDPLRLRQGLNELRHKAVLFAQARPQLLADYAVLRQNQIARYGAHNQLFLVSPLWADIYALPSNSMTHMILYERIKAVQSFIYVARSYGGIIQRIETGLDTLRSKHGLDVSRYEKELRACSAQADVIAGRVRNLGEDLGLDALEAKLETLRLYVKYALSNPQDALIPAASPSSPPSPQNPPPARYAPAPSSLPPSPQIQWPPVKPQPPPASPPAHPASPPSPPSSPHGPNGHVSVGTTVRNYAGTTAREYKVTRIIADAGMAVVCEVEGPNGVRGLMKTLSAAVPPQDVADYTTMLQSEGRTQEAIDNQFIPKVLDFFEENGRPYLVMEFIEGKNLLQIQNENFGLMPVKMAAEKMRQVLSVLINLHGRTPPIIHRDLKPGNIMVRPDGRVVLVDFGIARTHKANQRQDTVFVGTDGFAAPEQGGVGGQSDARTDVYGAGATLYALVEGHPPKDGVSRLLDGKPLEFSLIKDPELQKILSKALEPRPENRYQSALEMRKALQAYLQSFGPKR